MDVHLTCCLAASVITTLVLYAAFPNKVYYVYLYVHLVRRRVHTVPTADDAKELRL
jgi:hypothetical protein